MASRSLQYLTIFFVCFVDVLGFGIVIPVLPLYAEHFGATPLQIGWLVGIFSLVQFLFAPMWGKLSDRFGRRPVLLIGVAGTVAGYLLMGLAQTVTVLIIARAIDGIAGANIGAAQAYLADISAPENRAKAMGMMGAAFGLGFVFGPALGGWATVFFQSYAAPMYIAAGLAAVNFLFVLFCLPESRVPGAAPRREPLFPNLLSHVQRGTYLRTLAGYFFSIAGFSMMTTVFSLMLLHRFGLDAAHAAYIFAGVGIIGVVIQGGLIGRLVRRFGEAPLAFAGCVFTGAGLLGLALSRNIPEMLAATVLVGVGNSLLMPTMSSLASRSADEAWQGRALGVMQSGGSLARWLGPLFAGLLLALQQGQGPYALWPLAASAGVLLVATGVVLSLRNRPPAQSGS